MEIKGRINSFQSLGTLDGPGLRYVIFMQGCPFRCVYCHNPDTWDFSEGNEYTVSETVKKAVRFRPYFKDGGGVTLTGGEPLMQPEFAEKLFEKLHSEGINTALDTTGAVDADIAERVLKHTDLALVDIKFTSCEKYRRFCGADFERVRSFLDLTRKMGIKIWTRTVIVPGFNDSEEDIGQLKNLINNYPNVQKVELLPFRKLCIEKYERLGIEFPMKNYSEETDAQIEKLYRLYSIL